MQRILIVDTYIIQVSSLKISAGMVMFPPPLCLNYKRVQEKWWHKPYFVKTWAVKLTAREWFWGVKSWKWGGYWPLTPRYFERCNDRLINQYILIIPNASARTLHVGWMTPEAVQRIPQPVPDSDRLYYFKKVYDTGTYVNEDGTHWTPGDFEPRACIKKAFTDGCLKEIVLKQNTFPLT